MRISSSSRGAGARRRGRALWGLLAALALSGCREPQVTVAVVGDVMLGREVARVCGQRGTGYPLAEVAPILRSADLAFGNLECVLTDSPVRFPRKNALLAGPEFVPALAEAGFDVVGLANNHAVDGGRTGLRRMMELLAEEQIAVVGAGRTPAEAASGVVRKVGSLRVGFIAFSDFPYANFVQDNAREAILVLSDETLRRCLPPLRRRCDLLLVGFHWGKEGSRVVSNRERALAHLAVDLGATIVAGSHSHVRAPLERYGHSLIAYGLGNLVFDDLSYGGNEGAILVCRLGRSGVQGYRSIPTRVRHCRAVVEEFRAVRQEVPVR